jgi:hypothetical protein
MTQLYAARALAQPACTLRAHLSQPALAWDDEKVLSAPRATLFSHLGETF